MTTAFLCQLKRPTPFANRHSRLTRANLKLRICTMWRFGVYLLASAEASHVDGVIAHIGELKAHVGHAILFLPLLSALRDSFRGRAALQLELIAPRHRLATMKRTFGRPSRRRGGGRPAIPRDVRALISRMTRGNPLRGAPRIHGELLKLGIEASEATVSKYLARLPKPPSQTWRTFLRNHAKALASIDFLVLPTATFRLLMVFIVLRHERRQVVHFGVTAHPTAAWVAQQITEAFPWNSAPRNVIRDRDSVTGALVRATIKAMGIEEVVTAPRSPWRNPYVERMIGSIRRECLDHLIVVDERHLRRILASYLDYYHRICSPPPTRGTRSA